jgi:uncharacterized protein YciI
MLFALICTDKPDHLDLRMKNRPDHVAYLKSLGDQLKAAGPFLDDAGDMRGGMVVVDCESRAAAEAIAANDPYALAGLFAGVDIRPWKWTLKNPEAV